MKIIRSTNDRLVDVIVFDPQKNIKLQPVTPLMPLEALLIPVNPTNSDYDGINGGTGCNFIFFFSAKVKVAQLYLPVVARCKFYFILRIINLQENITFLALRDLPLIGKSGIQVSELFVFFQF